jgi:hypothetical protein
MITLLKIVFVFLTTWMTIINLGRMVYRNKIHWFSVFLQAFAITGLVTIYWLI